MFYFSVISHVRAALFFNVLETLKQLWDAETIYFGFLFQFYFTCASVWNKNVLSQFHFSFILCCASRLRKTLDLNVKNFSADRLLAEWSNKKLR